MLPTGLTSMSCPFEHCFLYSSWYTAYYAINLFNSIRSKAKLGPFSESTGTIMTTYQARWKLSNAFRGQNDLYIITDVLLYYAVSSRCTSTPWGSMIHILTFMAIVPCAKILLCGTGHAWVPNIGDSSHISDKRIILPASGILHPTRTLLLEE